MAPRRQIGLDDTLSDLELPAFLKSADAEATAWGYAVRYCETSKDVAEAQESLRSQGVSRGLLETAMPIERCWCANLIVTEDGVTYAGAAEQLFEAPGRQLGNVIDPENPFPDAGIALACAVADEARRMGFIGVVGLDIGRTTSGQMIVFDPNFRFNACTVQVLLHDSAAARGVGSVSRSFSGTTTLSCAACIDQVRGAVADGWFVPLRVIDPAYMAVAEGTCLVSGFVMGADHAEAERRHDALLDRLA